MRNWRNWLLPLLTVLAVGVLARLPQELSRLEDGRRSGILHSEELGGDSNFPAKAPDLPGRIWLLAQWRSLPEGLTIMEQVLEGAALEEAAVLCVMELQRLEESGILPEGSTAGFESVSGSRLYLRDQEDLSSASFLELYSFRDGKGWENLLLLLDEESGRILSLEMHQGYFAKNPLDANALGRAFLNGLEVEGELLEVLESDRGVDGEAVFRLAESRALCRARQFWDEVSVTLEVDWDRLNSMVQDGEVKSGAIQSALGYDSDG